MNNVEKFLKSKLYILFCVIFTLFFWVMQGVTGDGRDAQTIGLWTILAYVFVSLIIVFILFFYKNAFYLLPISLSAMFITGISNDNIFTVDTLNNAWYLYILIGIVLFSLIFHMLRYKTKIHYGALSLGFLLIAIGYILPFSLNENTMNNIGTYIFQTLLGPGYLLLYLFLFNSCEEKRAEKYFFIFLCFGIMIATQFYFEYIRMVFVTYEYYKVPEENVPLIKGLADALLYLLKNDWMIWGYKKVELGFDNINSGVVYLTMIIPVFMYYICKKNNNGLYILGFFYILVAGGLSLSRGGYIGLMISLVLCIVVLIKYASRQSKFVFLGVFLLMFTILAAYPKIIYSIVDFLRKSIVDGDINQTSSHRIELYKLAIEEWLMHPFVGGGWFSNIGNFMTAPDRPVVYHSTIFHCLATMGLVGLAGFIFHIYQVIRLIKRKWGFSVVILGVSMLSTQIHGLIDNTFYMINYMIITIIFYIIIERTDTIIMKGDKSYYDSKIESAT